jgi:hypothetical protein
VLGSLVKPRRYLGEVEMSPKQRLERESKAGTSEEKCENCLKIFAEQGSGVQCDLCCIWLHNKCQGVTDLMFKPLNLHSNDLFWFCEECRQGAEKLLPSISKFQTKVDKLETVRMNNDIKTELNHSIAVTLELKIEVENMGSRIEQCEKRADENKNGIISSIGSKLFDMETKILNKQETKWSEILTSEVKSKVLQATRDIISANASLQQNTKAIIENQKEQDEIKRRFNVIIHGVVEPVEGTTESRAGEDEDKILHLLHELSCDDASVSDTVRLGKRAEGNATKPRPVKPTLASEGLEKDLTPNQRESRNMLVEKMKGRLQKEKKN